MKCYEHNEVDATGICKHCHKGICRECTVLVDGSLSCAGECEPEVAAYNYMMNKGKRVYKNLGKQWAPATIINGIGGLIFMVFGLISREGTLSKFLIIMGIVMIIGGILSFIQSRRMSDK